MGLPTIRLPTVVYLSGLTGKAMKKHSLHSSPSTVPFILLSAALVALIFFVVYPNEFRLQSIVTSRCGSRQPSSVATFIEPVAPKPDFRLLMGILSLPDSYERRHLMRNVYALQPNITNAQIDVRFVFCNLTKEEQRVLVAMEIVLYDDIIILDCGENMDRGKTYAYFSSLPKMLEGSNGGDRPYDYVMKVDDDTYFRLHNLAESLRKMPREDVYYGLINPCWIPQHKTNYMTGMGYLLSWDLVEWIATSELPRKNQVGPEDFQTGLWMREGGRGKKFNMEPAMYDYMEEPRTCHRHEFIPDTIAVHKLKSHLRWARTLNYFNVTAGLKPSKLYHIP
ncbi:Galactosyltransferase [Musa troglodytarum]|uniref:Hexosyltransferase n=1 Tax=Musa troglodytarum TaxID=320322 RepID=A0A9E7JVN9_9LILI|nr:Galactosyltransferase [Musa troglodytarum]